MTVLLIIIITACSPQAAPTIVTSTVLPSSTTSGSTAITRTRVAPTATIQESITAPAQPGGRRLDKADAEKLIRTRFQRDIETPEIDSIKETTPTEVWQQVGVQIFQAREAGAPYLQSYLIHDKEVWTLHTGFDGFGVQESDLVSANLDQDGQLELVYAFAKESEIRRVMRLAVFRVGNGAGERLEMDWTYPGQLDLRKDEEGKVQVLGTLIRESMVNLLGYLALEEAQLSLVADPDQPGALATYQSQRFCISFQYPAGWEPVGDDHYRGDDGFFQISPYESIASGLSDDYHRVSFRMLRTCTWEVNAQPGRYGQDPEVHLVNDVPGTARCQILPGANAQEDRPTLLLEAADGGFAIVRADEHQLALIDKSLQYHFPEGQEPHPVEYPFAGQSVAPELALETRQLGELTVEEYSIFPQDQTRQVSSGCCEKTGSIHGIHSRTGLRGNQSLQAIAWWTLNTSASSGLRASG